MSNNKRASLPFKNRYEYPIGDLYAKELFEYICYPSNPSDILSPILQIKLKKALKHASTVYYLQGFADAKKIYNLTKS